VTDTASSDEPATDRRRGIDVIIALITVAIGVGIVIVARGIRRSGPVMDPIGPRALPIIIGSLLVVGGTVVAIREFISWRRHPDAPFDDGEPDEAGVPASAPRALALMALSLIYMLTLEQIGYIIGTLVFVVVGLRMLGIRSWLALSAISIVYTVGSYLIFAELVLVNLPLGPMLEPFRAVGIAR
jgi:putative tricarboxylic transport membrane protein